MVPIQQRLELPGRRHSQRYPHALRAHLRHLPHAAARAGPRCRDRSADPVARQGLVEGECHRGRPRGPVPGRAEPADQQPVAACGDARHRPARAVARGSRPGRALCKTCHAKIHPHMQ